MAGEIVTVTGIEEVCAFFDQAPQQIVKGAFGKALAAAAVPIVQELEVRTPGRLFDEETFRFVDEEGRRGLREALRTDIEISGEGKGGVASIGYGRLGHIANFVEYGHRMVGHKPKLKALGNVQPHPFMRPAADASAERAIDAFAESVEESMRAEGYGS